MQTSEQTEKLMQALINARSKIRPAGKSGENKYDKYDYATELDWHAAVVPALLAERIILTMSCDHVEPMPDRTTKNGGIEHCVQVRGSARVTHESGQWLEVNGVGQGQDRADKAAYKATTGLKKYLYALLFALPTTDDPERDESVGLDRDDRRQVEQRAQSNGHANGKQEPPETKQFAAFQASVKAIFDKREFEQHERLARVKEACRQANVDLRSLRKLTDESTFTRLEQIIWAGVEDNAEVPF